MHPNLFVPVLSTHPCLPMPLIHQCCQHPPSFVHANACMLAKCSWHPCAHTVIPACLSHLFVHTHMHHCLYVPAPVCSALVPCLPTPLFMPNHIHLFALVVICVHPCLCSPTCVCLCLYPVHLSLCALIYSLQHSQLLLSLLQHS